MHELVGAVKDLAIELGRTPRRQELEDKIISGHAKLAKVGGYTVVLRAAGLQENITRKQRVTNSIFNKDIEKHLEDYVPRKVKERVAWPTIAVISDIHWPFGNKRVADKFLQYISENKPEYVILNGDAWDMYSFSKFPRSHNLFTPREETTQARKMNEDFWKAVKLAAPASKCFQLLGNHDLRPLKRIIESVPAFEDWAEQIMKEQFTFEGVTTIYDPREELFIGEDIIVLHGYRSQAGSTRDHTLYNVFCSHTHKGGSWARRIRGETLIETNSGLGGDPEAKGLSYTPQKITDQTPGFAVCDKWGPRFVPV